MYISYVEQIAKVSFLEERVSAVSNSTKKTAKVKKTTATKGSTEKTTDSAQAVTIDRRARQDRRGNGDRRQRSEPVAVERRALQRREKVVRRRQIDPTTCEREYSDAELEFMNALDAYKRRSGRMFPTCSEVLEVLLGLGYEKRPVVTPAAAPAEAQTESAPVVSA